MTIKIRKFTEERPPVGDLFLRSVDILVNKDGKWLSGYMHDNCFVYCTDDEGECIVFETPIIDWIKYNYKGSNPVVTEYVLLSDVSDHLNYLNSIVPEDHHV